MVRRWSPSLSPAEQQQHQHHQWQQQEDDPISFYNVDSCFADHFPDFDPIKEWLVDPDHNPMPDIDVIRDCSDGLEPENCELGLQDSFLPASIGEKMEKVSLAETPTDPNGDGVKVVEVLEAKMEVGDEVPNVLSAEVKTVDGCINDVVSEVCLVTDPVKASDDTDDEEKCEESKEESEDSSSESSSSSSSSSEEESSSSDEELDNDGGGEKVVTVETELEEGEINGDDLEQFILGSDGEEAVPKGPIKSKHEIEDLPPVPPLEVSLEPHHQTLPVGFVSSILGNRVIVEGSEKHSPLNEGSVLWITELRSPLGIIDEIFGPVKNPYYIVRYNSDEEVPPGTIVGVAVSFVVDFANHILNEKYLRQKGYDASGNDDEEVTDEAEFSDDEKEAEHRRSLRQNKRNANSGNQEPGFDKKGAGFRDKQLRLPPALPAGAVNRPRFSCNDTRESANSGGVVPSPSAMPAFPSQPQAFQMGVSGPLGNTVHQFNAGSVRGFSPQAHATGIQGGFPPSPQFMAMQGGGGPLNWLSGQQVGDLICNLQNQAQVFNNFASGLMPYQQQHQHLVPYIGAIPGNFQWAAGLTNPAINPSSGLAGLMGQGGFSQMPSIDPSSALAGLMGQGGFSQMPSIDPSTVLAGLMGQGGFNQVPFGRGGNVNPQGSSASGNVQNQGLQQHAVNQGDVRPSSMRNNIGHDPSSAFTGLMGQGGFNQVPFGRGGNVNPQGSSASGNVQNQGLPHHAVNQGDVRPSSVRNNIGHDPSSAFAGFMGQGGFNQVPFGRGGNVKPQGSSASGNLQNQGLQQPAVNQGDVRPSSMHNNIGRFNRGRSSFRGRRPYQRGGHRSFGRGGSSQPNR